MDLFIKIFIVVLAIFLFVGSFLLNKRIKVPTDEEVGFDKCSSCSNTMCKKTKKVNCEEETNEK